MSMNLRADNTFVQDEGWYKAAKNYEKFMENHRGKKVVFIYQKGKAMWRYVTTGYENSTEVSIEEGISPGDTVIYDNNLGLSHMNTVVIEN